MNSLFVFLYCSKFVEKLRGKGWIRTAHFSARISYFLDLADVAFLGICRQCTMLRNYLCGLQSEGFCVHRTRRYFADAMGEDAAVLKVIQTRKTRRVTDAKFSAF